MSLSPELLKQLLRKQKEKTINEREMVLLRLYLSTQEGEETLNAIDFSDMPEATDTPGASSADRYDLILSKTIRIAKPRFQWRKYIPHAAAALLIVTGAAVLFKYAAQQSSKQISADTVTHQTGYGEIKEIILPDNSRVWLNARSVLTFTKTFDAQERIVQIEQGQAFFDVASNPQQPFVVETRQGIKTIVLGTSFSVAADSISGAVQVAVRSGKVSVEKKQKTAVVLLPGDQADYDHTAFVPAITKIDATAIGQWKSGEIKLKQADFATMSSVMKQLFGVTILPGSNTVHHNLYSLTIRYNADPQKLVEVISGINGNRYQWKNTDSTIVVIN